MNTQPEALRLAAELEDAGKPTDITDAAAAELRRLHEINQELRKTLHSILNISLMDSGHWSKTIEVEAQAAIAKAEEV